MSAFVLWCLDLISRTVYNTLSFLRKNGFPLLVIAFAIFSFWTIFILPERQTNSLNISNEKDRITLENTIRGTWIQAVGGAFFFLTVYLTWKNLISSEDKQVTERFAKAIEMLGNEKSFHVRIGGIYSLERISKESIKDYWTIIEILAAFIRNESQNTNQYTNNQYTPPPDVQAAITVIGRRNFIKDPKGERIDLSFANLNNYNFSNGKFMGVNFIASNLNEALFTNTDLSEALLIKAKLKEAKLQRANLRKANLSSGHVSVVFQNDGADLTEADLTEADLAGADLRETDLKDAILSRAKIKDANFIDAKNLNPEQIKVATDWDNAKYNKQFSKELGLQP